MSNAVDFLAHILRDNLAKPNRHAFDNQIVSWLSNTSLYDVPQELLAECHSQSFNLLFKPSRGFSQESSDA